MRFSIVIPTRNRAGKLRHALRSALAQVHDDFEVVVSNNQSRDATEEIVLAEQSQRLRYVKAPYSMSMVDHWEFALAQARGDWTLFLCDDDALMPGALATLDQIAREHPRIELIQYGVINYVYDDGISIDGNYVDVPRKASRQLRLKSSRRLLYQSFRRLSGDMPKFLNSAVRKDLIERVRRQYGRIFWNWAPDYASASLLLANTRTFARTGPLMLWGENLESYGAGSARDPNHLQSFFRQFETFDGKLPLTPYPNLLTVQNCVYDTFARVKNLLGPDFANLWIDPIRYRRILVRDCLRYVANGFSGYDFATRQLKRDIASLRRQRLSRPVWGMHSLLTGFTDLLERLTRSAQRRLSGTRNRARMCFDNICEAAAILGELACPVQQNEMAGVVNPTAEAKSDRSFPQHANQVLTE